MAKIRLTLKTSGIVAVILVVLFSMVTVAFAQSWADNRIGEANRVFSPANLKWEPGNPPGYAEGDTAAVAVRLTNALVSDGDLMFEICLDLNASKGGYGFTAIEPWDKTVKSKVTALPDGTPVTGPDWGTTPDPSVVGYNADIVSVTPNSPLVGGGSCASGYIGWKVVFRMKSDGNGYVLFGAHLARPGDPLPPAAEGGPGGTVPDGQGASSIQGTFQIRLVTNSTGAAKTVNFRGNQILPPPTAVNLVSFGGYSGGLEWLAPILIAAAILIALGMLAFYRQRQMARF